MLGDVVGAYVDGATAEGYAEDWDLDKLWTALGTLYPIGLDREKLVDGDADDLTREALAEAVLADAPGGLRPARGRDRRRHRRPGRHA